MTNPTNSTEATQGALEKSERGLQPDSSMSIPSVCSFSVCDLICRKDEGTIDDHFYCKTHNRYFFFERVKQEQLNDMAPTDPEVKS